MQLRRRQRQTSLPQIPRVQRDAPQLCGADGSPIIFPEALSQKVAEVATGVASCLRHRKGGE